MGGVVSWLVGEMQVKASTDNRISFPELGQAAESIRAAVELITKQAPLAANTAQDVAKILEKITKGLGEDVKATATEVKNTVAALQGVVGAAGHEAQAFLNLAHNLANTATARFESFLFFLLGPNGLVPNLVLFLALTMLVVGLLILGAVIIYQQRDARHLQLGEICQRIRKMALLTCMLFGSLQIGIMVMWFLLRDARLVVFPTLSLWFLLMFCLTGVVTLVFWLAELIGAEGQVSLSNAQPATPLQENTVFPSNVTVVSQLARYFRVYPLRMIFVTAMVGVLVLGSVVGLAAAIGGLMASGSGCADHHMVVNGFFNLGKQVSVLQTHANVLQLRLPQTWYVTMPAMIAAGWVSSSGCYDCDGLHGGAGLYDVHRSPLHYQAAFASEPSSWCAEPHTAGKPAWISIDLQRDREITGIRTQGRPGAGQWVKQYSVQYQQDGSSLWITLNSATGVKFIANSDEHTVVQNSIFIKARHLRLVIDAVDQVDFISYRSLRWDVLFAGKMDLFDALPEGALTFKSMGHDEL